VSRHANKQGCKQGAQSCLQSKPQMQPDPGQDDCKARNHAPKLQCGLLPLGQHTQQVNSTATGSCAPGNQRAPTYMPRWVATGSNRCDRASQVLFTANQAGAQDYLSAQSSPCPATLLQKSRCHCLTYIDTVAAGSKETSPVNPPSTSAEKQKPADCQDCCEGGPWVLDKPASQQAS
jgi:hypothetical protein